MMSIFSDSKKLKKHTDEVVLWMRWESGLEWLTIQLDELLNREHLVLVTNRAYFTVLPKHDRFLGLTRTFGDSAICVIRKNRLVGRHALIAHELVHAMGGNEIDAEYVELLSAYDFDESWQQSIEELREWRIKGEQGVFVPLQKLIDLYTEMTDVVVVQ